MHKGLLAILVLAMMFQALAFGEDLAESGALTQGFDVPDSAVDLTGWLGFFVSVATFVGAIIGLTFRLLTFGAVEGIPVWLRAGINLFFGLAFAEEIFSIASRLLDVLGGLGDLLPFT